MWTEKAIAHPVDSRLQDIARRQLVQAARAIGITFKQTYDKECTTLRRKAGGYGHARQLKRLGRIVKRQRTILGILLRECGRKLTQMELPPATSKAMARLQAVMQRAQRIYQQRTKDQNKLYAMHAPEVECIGKGKARKPYEFGVKVSIAVTHSQGLVVGARSFTGNPYDGHTLNNQLEQSRTLLEDVGVMPREAVVDLGFRGVDWDNPGVEIIHRGKIKQLSAQQKQWLRRRQAVEPVIGHLKDENGMRRCWLKGALGDALNAVLCAAGYNLRWLMRAVVRLGLGTFFALAGMLGWALVCKRVGCTQAHQGRLMWNAHPAS